MRHIAFLLVTVILVTAFCTAFVFADNYSGYTAVDNYYMPDDNEYASRERVVAEFIKATGIKTDSTDNNILKKFSDYGKIAGIYAPAVAVAVERGLVSGYEDKSFKPKSPITRIEALVILNRILMSRTVKGNEHISFTDTPMWATEHIDRLASAGIVKGYGDGTLGARDLLTLEQVGILTERAARMMGPTGDFYEYVNAGWKEKTGLPSGKLVWSDLSGIQQMRKKQIGEIVYSLHRRKYKEHESFPQRSSEQKIADVFSAAGNTAYRDKVGIEPAKPYLKMIDEANGMYALLKIMAELEKNGFHGLLSIGLGTDIYNSSEYILTFSECYTGINPVFIEGEGRKEAIDAYKRYIKELFVIYGYDNNKATKAAAEVAELCVELADASAKPDAYSDGEDSYKAYTPEERRRIFNKIDTNKFLKYMGFADDSKLVIYDLPLAEAVNKVWCEDKQELIKNYLRASIMDGSALYLNTDTFSAWRDYQDSLSGTKSGAMSTDYAVGMVEELLGWDLAKIYVKEYASPEDKEEVKKLTETILEAYIKILDNNKWLSEDGKKTAIKKIENLRIKVGYPDDIEEYTDSEYEIRSIKDGGNLLEYRCGYCRRYFEEAINKLKSDRIADRERWSMLPQTVNAMYEPSDNSITIPAGFLYEPFFDINSSKEANLGGIGTVIAHEISHALDSVGSHFDENGNLKNWWKSGDEKKFNEICSKVIEEYNKVEVIPDEYVDGKLTLGENIADIAAMECIMNIANDKKLNIGRLFKSYASTWRMKADNEYILMQLNADTHSPDKIRVNRVLSNFDAFVNYYNVMPGDGMYLPESERIHIWVD